MTRSLTLVLIPTAPASTAGAVLRERFPIVRVETGAVLVGISGSLTPETVLAYCRDRQLEVVASCVVSRTVYPAPVPVQ